MSEGAKIGARYDPTSEMEVLKWVREYGELPDIKGGQRNVELGLKNGVALVKIAMKVQEGTADCPEKAKKMRLKPNTLNAPFKQMENIQMFIDFCLAYGVPKTCTFQTVDLYEGRNMGMVLAGILALGTEAQRYSASVTSIGNAPAPRKRTGISLEKIRASNGVIGQQSGSNQYASQKGMTGMGAIRHGRDIAMDKSIDERCNAVASQQIGSNQYASQKGMRGGFGAIRHVSDIRADDVDPTTANVFSQQLGTNQFASQKGMRCIGSARHAGDIRADDCDKEGEGCLPSQSGTNQYATQKGMRLGSLRHGADMDVEKPMDESNATVGCQMGSNQYASQKGMNAIGGVRHIGDINCAEYDQASHGIMGQQAGSVGFASQSGETGFGSVRHGADLPTTKTVEWSEFFIPSCSGTNKFASQKGMMIGGVRHGADNAPKDILSEALQQALDMGWED